MTIRETTVAKLQQLPESLLQQVSDFIDLLTDRQQHSTAIEHSEEEPAETWARWFESVDCLEIIPTATDSDYQQLLLSKYRQQGLEL
jgi:hypothetical protein